jgi:hypothetical protein
VTFVSINKTVIVDYPDNEMQYIITNPHNLERSSTVRVKQEHQHCEALVIYLLYSSEDKISVNELEDMEEEEEGEGKELQLGMPEHQDDSHSGIMLITHDAPPSLSIGRTVKHEHQDFNFQYADQLDQVDVDFDNIALTELEGAKNPDTQAQKDNQADNANVDW